MRKRKVSVWPKGSLHNPVTRHQKSPPPFFSFRQRWEYFWKGINFSAAVKTVWLTDLVTPRRETYSECIPCDQSKLLIYFRVRQFSMEIGSCMMGWNRYYILWMIVRLKFESFFCVCVKGFHCFQTYNNDSWSEQAILLECGFESVDYQTAHDSHLLTEVQVTTFQCVFQDCLSLLLRLPTKGRAPRSCSASHTSGNVGSADQEAWPQSTLEACLSDSNKQTRLRATEVSYRWKRRGVLFSESVCCSRLTFAVLESIVLLAYI